MLIVRIVLELLIGGDNIKSIPKKYQNVTELNKLLSYYDKNNIRIIMKTCQLFKKSSSNDNPYRAGRFNLNKNEHRILQHHNGFYLFIVLDNKTIIKGKLVKAITIHNLNISHSKVFNGST